MVDIGFRNHSEGYAILLAPSCGSFPFGIVQCHGCFVFGAACIFHGGLTARFDLNEFCSCFSSAILIHYEKIRNINCVATGQWILIRYTDALTGPLDYSRMVIAELHKCQFPSAAICWSLFPHIFFRMQGLEFSLREFTSHVQLLMFLATTGAATVFVAKPILLVFLLLLLNSPISADLNP